MDPLSATASIIAVIQLSGSVISICYSYLNAVKNAPKDIRAIIKELQSLRGVLERLEELATSEETTGSSRLSTLERLRESDGLLAECAKGLSELEKKLKVPEGWKGRMKALSWPLEGDDVRKMLDMLERTKATLNLALVVDQTSLALVTHNSMTVLAQSAELTKGHMMALAESSRQAQSDTRHQEIHRWLSPPDPSTNHNDAYKKRRSATGTWFVGGEQFMEWKDSLNSFIWLHGTPGCGKTILCSTVIEDLLHHCQSKPYLGIAYFYFDFKDTAKQQSEKAIRSLIKQYSAQCLSYPPALINLFSQHRDGEQQPTTAALMKTLQDILGSFQHAYIILDALDECADCGELLGLIDDLVAWKLGILHMLVTSRKERDIELHLMPQVSGAINIQGEFVDNDIRSHICEQLQNDPKLRKWPAHIHKEIEETLTKGAHGMFRWVACQLDTLRNCLKPAAVRRALQSLPPTLDETYERILSNIDGDYASDAFKILQWLAFSKGPVTIEDVAEVLAVNFDNNVPQFMPDERLRNPEDVLAICSSLVTVSIKAFYGEHVLQLAHFSVKEYLISERIQCSTASQYYISNKAANTFISQTCLAYLLQFDQLDSLDMRFNEFDPYGIRTYMQFPLARYAAKYWMVHASEDCTSSKALCHLIMDLLQCHTPQYVIWHQLYENFPSMSSSPTARLSIPSPVFYVSLWGLVELVQKLLDNGEDINAQTIEDGNAVQAASSNGYEAVVQLLLDNGADVNAQGGHYGNALQAASSNGCQAVVQLLLDNGAEVNAQGGYYGIALQAASLKGNEAVVQLLLDNRADVNIQGGLYGNSLQAASCCGYEAVVQLLLDNGAEVNAQGGYYGSALQAASLKGDEAVVRLLLDNRADVNVQGGLYGNALQVASCYGYEVVVELLLDNGAEVNVQGGHYGSALQAASYCGYEAVVQLLLDNGAEVNVQGGQHSSALQAASCNGYEAIVQLLLDHGADVNAQWRDHGNALQAASYYGYEAVVQLLLDNGADVYAQGGQYGNALQAASCCGNEAVVQLLLDNEQMSMHKGDNIAMYYST